MNKAISNLSVWENLRPVDRAFTKPITGKSYRGDSPNPTYIIMKLTEILGPIGRTWGFEVKFDRIRRGAPHRILMALAETHTPPDAQGAQHILSRSSTYEIIREEYHEVCIDFWQIDAEGNRRVYSAFGGTPMLYMSKAMKWVHDEDAAKKSLTDAYTKAASWLGACADIFLGLYDDKYTSQPQWGDPDAAGSKAPPGPRPVPKSISEEWVDTSPAQIATPAKRTSTASDGW
jgi:hypothetical protein